MAPAAAAACQMAFVARLQARFDDVEVGSRPEMAGKVIVTIIPSFAERYLSTALFDGIE